MKKASKEIIFDQAFALESKCDIINIASLGTFTYSMFAAGDNTNTVSLWKSEEKYPIKRLTGHNSEITSLTFSKDEKHVAAGSLGGTALIWDCEYGKIYASLKGHMSSCDSIAISNELFKIATGSQDSNIKIWDTRSKNCVCTLKGHNKTITSLNFSSKGQLLASTSDDGVVKVWSIMTYKQLGEFKQPDISASIAKFSPTDNSLLVAYKDKRIYNIDATTFKQIAETTSDLCKKLEYSDNGKLAFTISDNSLRCFSIKDLALLDCRDLSGRKVNDISFNSQDQSLYILQSAASSMELLTAPISIFDSGKFDCPTPLHDINDAKAQEIKQITKQKSEIYEENKMQESDFKPHDIEPSNTINVDSFMKTTELNNMAIINDIMQNHIQIKQILQARKSNVLNIYDWWEKKNISYTLSALNMKNDLPTTCDFFNFTIAEGVKVDQLSIDNLIEITLLLNKLIQSKRSYMILCVFKSIDQIYKVHSESIIKARKELQVCADANSEDRKAKYDKIIEFFIGVKDSPIISKAEEISNEIGAISKKTIANLTYLLKECGC